MIARRVIGVALAIAVLAGCRSEGEVTEPEEPSAGEGKDGRSRRRHRGKKTPTRAELQIIVRASAESNDGRPVYVLVREVDEQTFLEESYAEVAALVVEGDDSVLATLLVFPGKIVDRTVERKAPAKSVAVYGLFTEVRGGGWKLVIERGEVIDLRLDGDLISVVPLRGR